MTESWQSCDNNTKSSNIGVRQVVWHWSSAKREILQFQNRFMTGLSYVKFSFCNEQHCWPGRWDQWRSKTSTDCIWKRGCKKDECEGMWNNSRPINKRIFLRKIQLIEHLTGIMRIRSPLLLTIGLYLLTFKDIACHSIYTGQERMWHKRDTTIRYGVWDEHSAKQLPPKARFFKIEPWQCAVFER